MGVAGRRSHAFYAFSESVDPILEQYCAAAETFTPLLRRLAVINSEYNCLGEEAATAVRELQESWPTYLQALGYMRTLSTSKNPELSIPGEDIALALKQLPSRTVILKDELPDKLPKDQLPENLIILQKQMAIVREALTHWHEGLSNDLRQRIVAELDTLSGLPDAIPTLAQAHIDFRENPAIGPASITNAASTAPLQSNGSGLTAINQRAQALHAYYAQYQSDMAYLSNWCSQLAHSEILQHNEQTVPKLSALENRLSHLQTVQADAEQIAGIQRQRDALRNEHDTAAQRIEVLRGIPADLAASDLALQKLEGNGKGLKMTEQARAMLAPSESFSTLTSPIYQFQNRLQRLDGLVEHYCNDAATARRLHATIEMVDTFAIELQRLTYDYQDVGNRLISEASGEHPRAQAQQEATAAAVS